MSGKIVIIGCGETAALAYEYFTHDSQYEVVAFAVDKIFLKEKNFCGLPVVSLDELTLSYPPSDFMAFVAMGSGELNHQRERMFSRLKSLKYTFASYVSSKAFVWHNVKIGENCFILEHNVLQPFSTVGNNVVMWSGNHLGHRSVIGDHCFITSHVVISGYCSIGDYTFMGVNSCVADNIKVERECFISMGAVITRNSSENCIYRGSPAMKVKLPARVFCGVQEVER